MFEFKGELSIECKKLASRKEKMVGFIICLITFLIFATINVIIALNWELIALIFLIPLACFPIFSLLPMSKKDQALSFPNRIYIDENDVISESDKFHHEIPTDYIKYIKDFGECYIIYFECPTRESQFACQKDLITIGDIEKFEEFFKDKIKKQY